MMEEKEAVQSKNRWLDGQIDIPRWFLGPAVLCFIAGMAAILMTDVIPLHLALNRYHPALVDVAMEMLTFIGDGWTAVVVTVALWWVNRRAAVISAAGNSAAGVMAQALKRYAFPGSPRPSVVFAQMHVPLPAVHGVQLYASNSFPSGHAATAWATFLVLALLTRRPALQLAALAGAILVAYSRVYLSQHFFADILAGAMLGTASTFCAFLFFRHILRSDRSPVQCGN